MKKAAVFLCGMALLATLGILRFFLPERAMSDMENRALNSFPAFSAAGLADGDWTEALERYLQDQIPFRDAFVSLYTALEAFRGQRVLGDGVILGGEGRLFDRSDHWSERNVRRNASALAELSTLTETPVYLLAVPSAARIYPQDVPSLAPMADEDLLFAAAGEETVLLPLLEKMEENAGGAPLYYRTDHHWTAAGARLGYLCACEALGLEALPEMAAASYPGFFGSFYARSPLPWIRSDVFEAPVTDSLRLIADGEEKQGWIDQEKLTGRDKYAAMFYGNHARMELINPDAPEGTLFVIKDSYANALLPALCRHYRRVVAVDGRYFSGNVADAVIESKGEAVLCIYGMSTLASGRSLALLEGL